MKTMVLVVLMMMSMSVLACEKVDHKPTDMTNNHKNH